MVKLTFPQAHGELGAAISEIEGYTTPPIQISLLFTEAIFDVIFPPVTPPPSAIVSVRFEALIFSFPALFPTVRCINHLQIPSLFDERMGPVSATIFPVIASFAFQRNVEFSISEVSQIIEIFVSLEMEL